jgi:hypothetical protein
MVCVVHGWFIVQEHDLYCSGVFKIVAVCVCALACSMVMVGNKGFLFMFLSCSQLTLCILAHNLYDLWNLIVYPL